MFSLLHKLNRRCIRLERQSHMIQQTNMADSKDKTPSAVMETEIAPVHKAEDEFVTLDNDTNSPEKDGFVGATLQLDKNQETSEVEVGFETGDNLGVEIDIDKECGSGISRNSRPGSTHSRRTTGSLGSITSISSTIHMHDIVKQNFFCKKPGAFDNAVEMCRESVLKTDLDGELGGSWLLNEIDHWDHEREKLVLLTDKTLLLVSYDFVTSKVKEVKRIVLHQIHSVDVGDFTYPSKSLMRTIQPRDYGGVRLHWGDVEGVTFGQNWNPFSTALPYTTLSHHPILYNPDENETVTYNVDDFYESMLQAVRKAMKEMAPEVELTVTEGPIVIWSYLSATSVFFNQSSLGFNKDRNGVSF